MPIIGQTDSSDLEIEAHETRAQVEAAEQAGDVESEPALEEQQARQAAAALMEMEVVEEEIRKSPPPAELDDVPVTQEAAA